MSFNTEHARTHGKCGEMVIEEESEEERYSIPVRSRLGTEQEGGGCRGPEKGWRQRIDFGLDSGHRGVHQGEHQGTFYKWLQQQLGWKKETSGPLQVVKTQNGH